MKLTDIERFDLFVTAIEGGSNYWYLFNYDELKPLREKYKRAHEPFTDWIWRAVQDGSDINVYDIEDPDGPPLGVLNLVGIERGNGTMEEQHRQEYADVIRGEWDAMHADIWFQYVVMNEVAFG